MVCLLMFNAQILQLRQEPPRHHNSYSQLNQSHQSLDPVLKQPQKSQVRHQ